MSKTSVLRTTVARRSRNRQVAPTNTTPRACRSHQPVGVYLGDSIPQVLNSSSFPVDPAFGRTNVECTETANTRRRDLCIDRKTAAQHPLKEANRDGDRTLPRRERWHLDNLRGEDQSACHGDGVHLLTALRADNSCRANRLTEFCALNTQGSHTVLEVAQVYLPTGGADDRA